MSKNHSSGSNSNAKLVKYNLRNVEGDERFYILSSRNAGALLEGVEPLSWRNRHNFIPTELLSNDAFIAWIDDLRLKLMTPLDFCQLMIDNSECFFADTTVQNNFDNQVIRSLSENNTVLDKLKDIIKNNSSYSSGNLTQNLLNDECNLDSIYAQVNEIVDVLDGLTEDILELIVQIEGIYERATTLISAIPVVEASPLPAIFDFVGEAITGLKSEYEGTFTLETSVALKCELFCLIKNSSNCEYNWTQLTAFFIGKLNAAIPFDNIFELINGIMTYLTTGDIDGDITVYALFAFVCTVLSSGSSFLGETFTKVTALIYSKRDETNNDWHDLCTDCAPIINIPAKQTENLNGTDTGYDVIEGLDYTINASRSWNGGEGDVTADGVSNPYGDILVLNGSSIYNLIGRIGTSGSWFAINSSLTFTASSSGRLHMMMNDGNDIAYYVDNTGYVTVTIS